MSMVGIDIGGSGVKGAPVDLSTGAFARDRMRTDTPRPAHPDQVARIVGDIVEHFGEHLSGDAPIGVTFPGVVTGGVTRTAANMDDRWVGLDAAALFAKATGRTVTVLNDADAAGIAEMRVGAGRGVTGTVAVLTLGTGIGSALFTRGVLLPNTEFGHLELDGHEAEHRASDRARQLGELGWEKWAHRLSRYLRHVEMLVSPDLIILGGGVSRKADRFVPHLSGVRAPVVPARLRNNAGIVGAAMAAAAEQAR